MQLNEIKYPETESEFIEMLTDFNESYRQSLDKTPKLGLFKITDEVYDAIVEDFRSKFPTSEFFESIEVEALGTNVIYHSAPMLSTEKAYTKEALGKWFARVETVAEDLHIEPLYKVTCKLDGFAGDHEFSKLSTRGDGVKGNDITHILAIGVTKPLGVDGRGEIVVSKKYFDENLSASFSHPRNMISSVVGADDVKDITKKALLDGAVHFVPYTTLPSYVGSAKDILENLESIRNELRNKIDYIIDGFVIESVVEEIKNYMGYNNHNYKWQIAFKERGDTALPKVLEIKLQIGRTGTITPVLGIEPTLLSGAVISNVTAHHMNNLRINKIGVGSVIELIRSGEVIPKIERVVTEADYEMPTKCPCCSTELVWESHFLYCPNHSGCSEQVKQSIQHFFSTLDNNDGFGGKTISKLVDAGFDTIQKIYAMDESSFLVASFGPGESVNLVKALEKSKSVKIEDWRFLSAFGISDLGRGDSKKLLENFSIDSLHEISPEKLLAIKGYGKVTSISITNGVKEKLEMINEIRPLFNLEVSSQVDIDMDSPFAGKNVVVTGTMVRFSRKDIEAFFTSKGAKVQSKVSKTTHILVYGENAGSKLEDANALKAKGGSIDILTENDFVSKYEL
jgi:DNA ligase (NAD+)